MTNFDRAQTVETVINLEGTNINEPNTMDLNKFGTNQQFYDNVTPVDITTSFEENVLKPETCTLPSPPITKPTAKRKAPMATTRLNTDITLEILDQRVNNLDMKLDNIERQLKEEIQTAKDEILAKIDRAVNYDRQLFHAVTTQFRETMIDLLSKSSQASFTILNSMGMQSTSNR